jgi:flagellar hook-associated protein 3 FlgL
MFTRVTSLGSAISRQQDIRSQQASLATHAAEVSSGKKSNLGQELGVGVSVLYRLYADVQQGNALQSAASVAGQQLDAMQGAMGSIDGLLGNAESVLLQYAPGSPNIDTGLLAEQGRSAMSAMASLLNTQLGGRSLFGGADSGVVPMRQTDAAGGAQDAILAQVTGPVGSADVAALMDRVGQIFDPASDQYEALFYQSESGSADPATQVRLGPGQTVSYNLRGDNQGFRDALEGFALLSLIDARDAGGAPLLDDDAIEAVRSRASSLIGGARESLTNAAGQIGLVQSRLEAASEAQAQAVTSATLQIGAIENVDYYAASTQIEALKVQLQATYSLTSSLSDLSLVNYLR